MLRFLMTSCATRFSCMTFVVAKCSWKTVGHLVCPVERERTKSVAVQGLTLCSTAHEPPTALRPFPVASPT